MDALSFGVFVGDVSQRFRTERKKVFCCAFAALIGTVLGLVAYNVSQYSWWGVNRCDYAYKLLYGGFFALFVAYLLCALVVCVVLCCSACIKNSQWLCVGTIVVFSIYFGANCCAVCSYSSFLGVLYALFLLLTEQAINWFCCFWACTEFGCADSFKQGFQIVKLPVYWQIASVFVKLLIVFVLLRTLTALI